MKKLLILSVIFVCLQACNKYEIVSEETPVSSSELTNSEANGIKEFLDQTPVFIRYIDTDRRAVEFNIKTGEHHFVQDHGRWDFANPSSSQIVFSSNNVVVYLSSPPGFNAPQTYTVTAGSTSLNVYTYCLAAQYNIATPFGMPINGASFVLGIDGTAGFFGGVAMYVVYDSPASGSYNSIDWQNYTGNSISSSGLAYVFNYNNSQIDYYLSESGTISVNNGDMTFNGDYYYLPLTYSAITSGTNYTIVPGSGTMGCQ
ncbi:hypothetical protein OAK19_05510 [Aureispira]|nr:hypothetical protein [Aureispira sp.]